jgi:hypothetical protein
MLLLRMFRLQNTIIWIKTKIVATENFINGVLETRLSKSGGEYYKHLQLFAKYHLQRFKLKYVS